MPQLPPGFVLDRDEPKPKVSAALPPGFVLADVMVQHAPGVTGQEGDGPSTDEPQEPTIGRKGDKRAGTRFQPDLGATTLQGATLNFGDEIVAGAVAPINAVRNYFTGEGPTSLGETYDQALAFQRAKIEATREQAPKSALASEIGGSLLTAKVPVGVAAQG